MDLVKKNILSVICGVVAILAVCTLFYPIGGWTSQLQSKLDSSKKNFDDKISALTKKPRKLPVVPDPNNPAADAPPLNQFPTQTVIDQGSAFAEQVKDQAQKMLDAVIERNRHTPIVDGFSAKTAPDSYTFGRAYKRWIGMESADDDPSFVTAKKLLQAIEPPNDDEVANEKKRIWNEKFQPRIIQVDGKDYNKKELDQEFEAFTSNLEEQMRHDRAAQYKLYMDPDAIEYSKAFAPSQNKQVPIDQIWYAQNMLWVDQDLCEAIARINKDAHNILDAPVKQLVKISIPDDVNQYTLFRPPNTGGPGAGSLGDQAPPAADDNAQAGKAFNISETGRVSNPLYDVVQFHVEMNVDATKIPFILTELQRGHLMSVFRSDAIVVDARAAVQDGYVYGTAPIMHLSLECEDLFLRGWTVGAKEGPLMPSVVQARLGIAQPGQ
jgi:hypothetical protein